MVGVSEGIQYENCSLWENLYLTSRISIFQKHIQGGFNEGFTVLPCRMSFDGYPCTVVIYNIELWPTWGCSSVGRAPALQAGGQGFESPHLHQFSYLDIASNLLDESYRNRSGKQGDWYAYKY